MRRLLALAGLLAFTEALFLVAPRARGTLVVDVGPSTGAYGAGFTDSEERPPTTFRWTRSGAGLALPLVGSGGEGVMTVRYGRPLDSSVRVQVLLSRRPVTVFEARPGRFRSVRLPVTLPDGRLRIDFWPEDGGELGVAIDWLQIAGGAWRIPVDAHGPRLLVAGTFLLFLAAGFPLLGALALAGTLALIEGYWAAVDPFGCVHVLSRLAVPALVLTGLALLIVRKHKGARWMALIFLAGYLAKGAGLFYPSYFYNDVRNNRRFVMALARPGGWLPDERLSAQVAIGVAYPRSVAGKSYAFPYSPVFFLPFTLLRQDHTTIDETLKHVALACAAAEVMLVFWIAGLVFGEGAGVGAAFVAALLPVFYSRLLLALWSTLGGHVFDTLVLGTALLLAAQPESRERLCSFAAAAQASLLTYVASLFNVTLFTGFLALLLRRLSLRVLAAWAVAVSVTLVLLHADFAVLFLREILPAFLTSQGSAGTTGAVASTTNAVGRIPLFYGWGLPALAVAGFLLARRKSSPEAVRVLAAHALAFAGLVALRALPGGLFKDMKEIEFVAPLVAVLAGASLEELWSRGRPGRIAACLVAVGLLAFAADRYAEFLAAWTALAPP